MDQNSFLSAFPSKSIPPLGGQTAVSVPGRLPKYTYAHTHTHALMPVDVCDGLCCFLINSSHADWSIHLITGCIDGPTVRERDRRVWTKTDNHRHKGAELEGQTREETSRQLEAQTAETDSDAKM